MFAYYLLLSAQLVITSLNLQIGEHKNSPYYFPVISFTVIGNKLLINIWEFKLSGVSISLIFVA